MKIFNTGLVISGLIMLGGCVTKPQQVEEPVERTRMIPRVSNNPYHEPSWGAPMEYKQF